MITKIDNKEDIIEFLDRVKDIYQEMYITTNKMRLFLNKSHKTIDKIIKHHKIYGDYSENLKGFFLIYEEKGFRPYLKVLSENANISKRLLKYILWNFSDKDLYIKLHKTNPLVRILQDSNFEFAGDRGSEILLIHKKILKKNNLIPKDRGE